MDDEFDIYNDLEEFDWQQKYLEQTEAFKQEQLKALTALNRISAMENDILNFKQVNEGLKHNLAVSIATYRKEAERKDGQILQLRKEKDNICFRRAPPTTNFKIPLKQPSLSIATQTDFVFNISTATQTDLLHNEISRTQNNKNHSNNRKWELNRDVDKYTTNYNNNPRDRQELTNKKRSSDFDENNSRIRTNDRFHGTSKHVPKLIPEPNRNDKKYSNDRHYNRRNDERCDKRKWSEERNDSRDYHKRGRYDKNYAEGSQKQEDDDLMKLEEKLAELRKAIQSEKVKTWEPDDKKSEKLQKSIDCEDGNKKLTKSRRMSPNDQIDQNVSEFSCKLPPLPVLSENLQPKNWSIEEEVPVMSTEPSIIDSSEDLRNKLKKSRKMSEELQNNQTDEKVPEDNGSNDKEHRKKVPKDNISNESSDHLPPVLSEDQKFQNENKSILSEVPIKTSARSTVPKEIMLDEKSSSEDIHKKGKNSTKDKAPKETISFQRSDPVSSNDLHKKFMSSRDQVPEEIICNEKSTEKASKCSKRKDKEIISKKSKDPPMELSLLESSSIKSKIMSDRIKEQPQNIQIYEQVPKENISNESNDPVLAEESLRPPRSTETVEKEKSERREEIKSKDPSMEPTLSESSDDIHKKPKRSRRMREEVSGKEESTSNLPERNKKSKDPSMEPSRLESSEDPYNKSIKSKIMSDRIKEQPQNIQIYEQVPKENISNEFNDPVLSEETDKKSFRSKPRSTFEKEKSKRREEIKSKDPSMEPILSESSDDLHKKPKRSRRMSIEEQQKLLHQEVSGKEESISNLPERNKKSKMSRRMSIYFGDDSLVEEPSKNQEVEKSKNLEIPEIPENHSDINLIINKKTGKVRRSSECTPTSSSQIPEKIDNKKQDKKSSGRLHKESMKTKNLEEVSEAKLPELQNETILEAVKFVEFVLPKISDENKKVENVLLNKLEKESLSLDSLEKKDEFVNVSEEKSLKKSEKSRKIKKLPEKIKETKKATQPAPEQLPEKIKLDDISNIMEVIIDLEKSSNSSRENNISEKNTEKSKKSSRRHKPIHKPEIVEKSSSIPSDAEIVETKIQTDEKPDKKSSTEVPQIIITAASRKSFDPPKSEEPPVLHSILRSSKTPTKNKKVRISDEFFTEQITPITPVIEIEVETPPSKAFNSIADLLNTPIKPEIVKVDEKIVPVNEEVIFMKSRKRSSKSNKNNSKKEEEEVSTNQILKSIENNSEVVCPPQKDIVVETVVHTEETEKRKSSDSYKVLEVVGNETVMMLNRKRKKKKDKK